MRQVFVVVSVLGALALAGCNNQGASAPELDASTAVGTDASAANPSDGAVAATDASSQPGASDGATTTTVDGSVPEADGSVEIDGAIPAVDGAVIGVDGAVVGLDGSAPAVDSGGLNPPDGGPVCTSDPACASAGDPACDPAGSGKVGTCTDVGGCLKVQALAACGSSGQTCPAGQSACGCPTTACAAGATQCGTSGVQTCAVDGTGCLAWGAEVACGAHQSCTGSAPDADCTCVVDADCGSTSSYCASSTSVGTCAVDGDGCFYSSSTASCPSTLQTCQGAGVCTCGASACTVGAKHCNGAALDTCGLDAAGGCGVWGSDQSCPAHEGCAGAAPSSACACLTDANCAGATGTVCQSGSPSPGYYVCSTDASFCLFSTGPTACASGQVCTGAAGSAICSCPATGAALGEGCATLGDSECNLAGTGINTCTNVGNCQVWQASTDCSATQHVCELTAGVPGCACDPTYAGPLFYADAKSSAPPSGNPTGALAPADCRFKTLGAAVTAANAKGLLGFSAQAIATGSTGAGNEVFAAETFPINVGKNVTVTTTDSPLVPANYVVSYNHASGSAFVLDQSAALSGFTVNQVSGAATDALVAFTGNAGQPALVETMSLNGTPLSGSILASAILAVGSTDITLTGVNATGFGKAVVEASFGTDSAMLMAGGGTWSGGLNGLHVGRGIANLNSVTITRSSGAGVALNRGTLTMTDCTVELSLQQGVLDSPSGGSAILTIYGGQLNNNTAEGLRVEAGSGASATDSVTVQESSNGVTAIYLNGNVTGGVPVPGVNILARQATLTGVNVHGNAGGGLALTGSGTTATVGSTVSGTPAHFDQSGTQIAGAIGISVANGAVLTAANAQVLSNFGAGVSCLGAAPGTASSCTLDGVTIDGNGSVGKANGLVIGLATVRVDQGSKITNNKGSGIWVEGAGVVTLDGSSSVVEVGKNGADGIHLAYAVADPLLASFEGNNLNVHDQAAVGAAGLSVANSTQSSAGPKGAPISIDQSTFTANATGILLVSSEPTLAGAGPSLSVVATTITGGSFGIASAAANTPPDLAIEFDNDTVTLALQNGVNIHSTAASLLGFRNVNVHNNCVPASGGTPCSGWNFTGAAPSAPLPSSNPMTFTGNSIWANGYDQLTFDMGASGAWKIDGLMACGASSNQITCYDTAVGGVGLRNASPTATVSATYEQFKNATPGATDVTGSVTDTPSCGAATIVCP